MVGKGGWVVGYTYKSDVSARVCYGVRVWECVCVCVCVCEFPIAFCTPIYVEDEIFEVI